MWRECHVHRTFMERLPGHMTYMTSTFDKFDRLRHKSQIRSIYGMSGLIVNFTAVRVLTDFLVTGIIA